MKPIAFALPLLIAVGIVSCSDRNPGGGTVRPERAEPQARTPDFFFPEIAFYRGELEAASLTREGSSLEGFLRSLREKSRAAGESKKSGRLDAQDIRMLRAVLYVVAVDRIPELASPILEVLPIVDDPRVRDAAARALVATLRGKEVEVAGRLRGGLADDQPEAVRVVCLRVAGRLGQHSLESRLVDLCEEGSPEARLESAIALARWGRPAGLEPLLSLLESDRLATRHGADVALRRWTGEDFGYSAYWKEEDRAPAIKRWREWLESFDRTLLQPLRTRDGRKVLAVRGSELLELGPDGRILHQQGGFNSLSEAVRLESGHRLVTDFMGRTLTEYDTDWREVERLKIPFQPRGGLRFPGGETLVIGMHQFQHFDPEGNAVDGPTTFPGRTNFTGSALVGRTRFLVTGNDSGTIREFDLRGQVLWTIQAENHPRSVQVLDDGRLLVADFRQAAIYTPAGKVEWRHKLDGVRSAHQLPSGNILLGHPGGLSVIDLSGEVLWEMSSREAPGRGFFAHLE